MGLSSGREDVDAAAYRGTYGAGRAASDRRRRPDLLPAAAHPGRSDPGHGRRHAGSAGAARRARAALPAQRAVPAAPVRLSGERAARRSRLLDELPPSGLRYPGRAVSAHAAARRHRLCVRHPDRHRDRHPVRGHAASQRRSGMVEPRADRLRDADLLGGPAARHGVLDPPRLAADARHGADDLARLGRRLAARAGDLSGAAGGDLHHPGNHPRGTFHACQRVGRRSSRDTSSRRGRKACRGARSSWGTWFAIRSCPSSR